MKSKIKTFVVVLLTVCLSGCAGFQKSCSSWSAENFASDWVVVQFDFQGKPFNCWKLKNTSVSNESNSDGIWWQDSKSGHLVHLSGWYNRVQVSNGDFEGAAKHLDVSLTQCTDGKYAAPATVTSNANTVTTTTVSNTNSQVANKPNK